MLVFRTAALQQGYAIFLLLAFSTLISAITVDVCSSFNTAETPLSKFGSSGTQETAFLTPSQMSAYTKRMGCARIGV